MTTQALFLHAADALAPEEETETLMGNEELTSGNNNTDNDLNDN